MFGKYKQRTFDFFFFNEHKEVFSEDNNHKLWIKSALYNIQYEDITSLEETPNKGPWHPSKIHLIFLLKTRNFFYPVH